MRRWWIFGVIWTGSVVVVAVVLFLTYARQNGPAACQGCGRTESTWNDVIGWTIALLAFAAIAVGNGIVLAGHLIHRRRVSTGG